MTVDDISETFDEMKMNGRSILINWSEDNDLWECSFIDGLGNRHTGIGNSWFQSIQDCLKIVNEKGIFYFELK